MGSIAEIESKSSKELREKLVALRRSLVECVFESGSGEAANNARKSMIKKEIARVLTVLSLRKIRGDDV